MPFNFLATADIFIFLQGMLLSALFLSSYKGNRPANLFLGLFIFSSYFGLLHSFFLNSGMAYTHTWLLGFPSLFLFWHGPLLYLYTVSLSSRQFTWQRTYNWYFVPAVAELLANLVLFAAGGDAMVGLAAQEWFWTLTGAAAFAGSCYTVAFAVAAMAHSNRKETYERLPPLTKNWLRYSLFYFATRALFVATYYLLFAFPGGATQLIQFAASIITAFTCLDFVVILAISFMSFRYNQLLHAQSPQKTTVVFKTANGNDLFEQLTALMQQEKLYRNSELKLSHVAARLNTNTLYVSQLVKQRTQGSFTQYINSWRVEEVKQHIAIDHLQHLTLAALAEESGFSSKATFYRVFKETTGMSPNDYRKEMLQQQETQ